jgi:hypothetical protein
MHGAYVQSTFAVIPLRWLDRFGWRAPSEAEPRLPPRREPRYVHQLPEFAIYPDGYRVEELGTFP